MFHPEMTPVKDEQKKTLVQLVPIQTENNNVNVAETNAVKVVLKVNN